MTKAPETMTLIRALAAPRRFLVVDDDAVFTSLLVQMAEDFNCTFAVAGTIGKGLEMLGNLKDYDVIWVDLNMGCGRSGLEILRAVKATDRLKPVVIVAGVLTVEDVDNIRRIGLAFMVVKPNYFTLDFVEEIFSFMGISKVRAK